MQLMFLAIMRRVMTTSAAALMCFAMALSVASMASAAASDVLSPAQAREHMQAGGVALLLRHGETEPGVGDPAGFRLDDCRTQRNLSETGRSALRGMSARVAGAKIRFAKAYSSRWCRCRESARLVMGAQGGVELWPALDSQFTGNPVIPAANLQVIERVRRVPTGETWLLVTHQVNITALTGVSPAPGEGVLVKGASDGIVVIGRVKL